MTEKRVRLVPEDFRTNHFNTIRLAMALLVIWSHCFAIYYGTEAIEPISILMSGTYNAGNFGVRIFFIISGFLITASFVRKPRLGLFLKHRIGRIYPGFIVAVAFCALVVIPLNSSWVDLSVAQLGKTALFALVLQFSEPASNVFAGHHGSAVNGALWSIPYEFWCYLAVAALGLVGLFRRRYLIVAVWLLFAVTKTWLDIEGRKPGWGIIGQIIGWPYLWFSIAPCFLVGMIVFLYRDHLPRNGWLALAALVALPLSAALSPLLCDFLFPPAVAYLTFYVALSQRPFPDAGRHGDISYGTYLYGFPLQQMLFDAHLPFALYVIASMLLAMLFGVASWFGVERHFLNRRRESQRKTATPNPTVDQADDAPAIVAPGPTVDPA